MRVHLLLNSVLSIYLLGACAAPKIQDSYGTIQGVIGIYEGNCMPSPDSPPCKPSPLSTTVLITEPSEVYDPVLLKDSIVSNAQGFYKIELPAGRYSLFLRDENEVICDRMECDDTCICMPFQIVSDSTTIVNANLDHASW